MSPSTLKKADLVEMATDLGLSFAVTSRKGEIESLIRDHLLSHREDISRDKRFRLFSVPVRGAAAKSSALDAAGADKAAPSGGDSESESSGLESEEVKLGAVRKRVDAGIAHVKETFSAYQAKTTGAISGGFSSLQHSVSTVATVNVFLILTEYAYISYSAVPAVYFKNWQIFGYDTYSFLKRDIASFTIALLILPLLLTFLVNFTKMDSIRRKKHVYVVDPILFGIIRFYIATFLFVTNLYELRRYSVLAAAAGISSALVGIYASLLQTS